MANEVKIVVTGQNKSGPALQGALSDVQKVRVAVEKIPDSKTIKVTVTDDATETIGKVDKETIKDKEAKVTADTDKAEADIKNVGSDVKPVTVPVEADTGVARDALQGLGDLGTNIGDDLTGGLTSGMMGGVAGAVAAVGGALAAGLIDKISEGNKIQRALELQFRLPAGISKQYAELFDTSMFEDINHFLGGGMADQTRQALEDIGIGAEQLSTNMVTLSRTFSDFGSMGVADQRALTVEMTKVAAAAGIDVPEALKGASAAAKTWGMSGWEATRLIDKGFQQMDARGDDWADTLGEYSPMFKRLGLDGDTALRLVSTGLDHGARDTDVMADAFKELALRVVDGSTLSRDAIQDLGLDAEKTMAAFGKGGADAKVALDTVIDRLNGTQDPIERNRLGVALLGTQWEDTMRDVSAFIDVMPGTTSALNSTGVQSQLASEKARGLSDAFTALKGPFESAATTADAVSNALDRMNGRTPALRDTTQAWNDLVREFAGKVDWDDTAKGVQGLSGSLVGLRGEVDTTTEAGSKLEDWAQKSREAFKDQAGALREAGVPAAEMTTKLQAMRDAFINNAIAQGLPREAALRLADAYNMVPKEVSTAIYAPNLFQRMSELGMLRNEIVTLPDGRFRVTADPDPARNTIRQIITDFQGKTITLYVTAGGTARETIRNAAGGRPFQASGGAVVGHAAEGGPRDGLVHVNEQGFELLRTQRGDYASLQSGQTVITAGKAAQMEAAAAGGRGGGGGSGGTGHVTLSVAPGSEQGLATVINNLIRTGKITAKIS